MFAYTAWDSLQTVARQFDADLRVVSDDHITLAPHRRRVDASSLRQAASRIAAGFAGFFAGSGLIVA